MLVATTVLWSTSGILLKLIPWNPVAIAGARSLLSGIVLLLYLRRPRFTWSRAQIGAAVSHAGMMLGFVAANKLTTSANAILLQYLAPVFVAVLGIWMLRELPTISDWIIIVVVTCGMMVFFFDRVSVTAHWGDALAVGSGIFMALFIIFMRMQKDGSPLESMLLGHFLTAVVALPFYFSVDFSPSGTGTTAWLALVFLGVVQLGVTSITFTFAIKRLTALGTAIISLIEPVLNPVWVFLFIGESPSANAVIGGAVILSMVTLRAILAVRRARMRGTGAVTTRGDASPAGNLGA